jgi:hypothetical protein
MQKRRDDYRCMSTDELIEETKRGHNLNWEELAVVLAERLKTATGGW